MEKQKLKDQISAMEEQLEVLGAIAQQNGAFSLAGEGTYEFGEDILVKQALHSLRGLQDLVHEQTMAKSLAAEEFLQKIAGVLIREARAAGYDVALSVFGSGRISMEMAEISMGAVLACVRASLRSYRGVTAADRQRARLFAPYAFYLEARATDDAIHFRLFDDGPGHVGSLREEFEAEKQFTKVRTYIAKHGGWFNRRSLPNNGGAIEIRVPLPLSRFECVVVQRGEFEALLPAACVAEIRDLPTLEPVEGQLAVPGAEAGLTAVGNEALNAAAVAVRVGVADFQFWLLGDAAHKRVNARRHIAGELVESGCWFGYLGIFQDGAFPRALPLLDGETLMNFHAKTGGRHEGV